MAETITTKGYRIFTKEFDVVALAEKLLNRRGGPALFEAAEVQIAAGERIALAPYFGKRPLVTLLVDHSGSLAGAPAKWVMSALTRTGRLLEASGIPFELLGFTTVGWHGGQSRKKWLTHGRLPFPGRLCDLLHIIYQDAEGAHPAWAQTLPLMTIPNFLKENIDGEALLWAYHRARTFGPSYWLCVRVRWRAR